MSAVRQHFAAIASVYDRANRVLSLGLDRSWRERAVRLLRGRCAAALDLACGTGDFSLAIARRFPEANVTGVDFTPEMLEIARAKTHSPRIKFRQGDAQDLSGFPDQSFDLVACAFGFRNFPDAGAALREARRVLRGGGELLVLEFFRPRSRILGALVSLWLRAVYPFFGARRREAYAHLRASIASTASEEEFSALASRAGFSPRERRFFFPCCTALVLA